MREFWNTVGRHDHNGAVGARGSRERGGGAAWGAPGRWTTRLGVPVRMRTPVVVVVGYFGCAGGLAPKKPPDPLT